jgi:hypothetical protein
MNFLLLFTPVRFPVAGRICTDAIQCRPVRARAGIGRGGRASRFEDGGNSHLVRRSASEEARPGRGREGVQRSDPPAPGFRATRAGPGLGICGSGGHAASSAVVTASRQEPRPRGSAAGGRSTPTAWRTLGHPGAAKISRTLAFRQHRLRIRFSALLPQDPDQGITRFRYSLPMSEAKSRRLPYQNPGPGSAMLAVRY